MERLATALAERYRIERELGAGGMATVYLAEDLRHARKVAVKVLKPELAAVVGGGRFLAEIRTTANLQHPHILPLFDSGEADGFLFYVMPYLEGESLRERLDREKQLPVDEAIRIAVKVAGALQAAHDRGIVHRDIKPANILLGERGEPLVADFGIALAVQEAGGGRLTETGLSLGTPYYMSPEQAAADRDPDARSDVYSLACVLYEMLAGEPPYTGATAQAVMAKILTKDPTPVTEGRKSVPLHVAAAVDRALQRLPADRFGTAAEFAAALEGRLIPGATVAPGSGGRGGGDSSRAARPWIAAALALAALAAWGWLRPSPEPATPVASHLAVPLPNLGGAATAQDRQLALSPDGSTLLYTAIAPDGENRTMRRRLHETESTVLGAVEPFLAGYVFSPDGSEFIGYDRNRRFYRYDVDGSNGRPLFTEELPPAWTAWGPDGSIWLTSDATESGLLRLTPDGQMDRSLEDQRLGLTIQDVLPDARSALAVRSPRGVSSGPVFLVNLDTGPSTEPVLAMDVVAVRYTAGHLVYVEPDGSLSAVPFDPSAGRVLGDPLRIAQGVTAEAGQAQLAVSRNGTVAYIPEEPRILEVVGRDGRRRPLTRENRNFHNPTFSPDGRRVAVDFTTADGRNVWTVGVDEGIPIRATFARNGHDGQWTPDGRELTYIAEPATGETFGIWRSRPGSMQADSVLTQVGVTFSGHWLSDQSGLVTTADGTSPGSNADIVLIENGGRGPVEPLVASRFMEAFPAVSPDDRWLAFAADMSGEFEVYVRPLRGDGPQVQISLDGGVEPVWGNDPRRLYYRTNVGSGSELVEVTLQTEPELEVVSREPLFGVGDVATATPHSNYDVSPDGNSFAVVRFNPASRIMVIQNLPQLVERFRGGTAR